MTKKVYWVVTDDGKKHALNGLDWKWTGAAGWDDLYEGQRVRGTTMSGDHVMGKLLIQED